jgi:hypothetical protein
MADNSQTQGEDVLTLAAQLEFAVRTIESDQHLRTLVRHFLNSCRVLPPASVFDLNPQQNAYNQGYQAAGLELASILTSVAPSLVPTLMLEEITADE